MIHGHQSKGMYPLETNIYPEDLSSYRKGTKAIRYQIPSGMVLRHKCDNGQCINPNHLEIGTQADNMRDKVERNRQMKGSKHWNSKLNEEQVKAILKSKKSTKQLAEEYGINYKTMWKIRNRKIWRDVK